jgi:hypothetical protein
MTYESRGIPRTKSDKPLSELIMDPHFVFTILSLTVSVGVFFYYLYKLLFCRDEIDSDEAVQKRLALSGSAKDAKRAAPMTQEEKTALTLRLMAKLADEKERAEAAHAVLSRSIDEKKDKLGGSGASTPAKAKSGAASLAGSQQQAEQVTHVAAGKTIEAKAAEKPVVRRRKANVEK